MTNPTLSEWEVTTADGGYLAFDFAGGVVTYEYSDRGRRLIRSDEFIGHPLSPYLLEWLSAELPGIGMNTARDAVLGLLSFQRYLVEAEYSLPSAEVFSGFLKWLKKQPGQKPGSKLGESARRRYSRYARDFLAWAPSEGLMPSEDVHDVEERYTRAFRGYRERESRRIQELGQAVGPEVLRRLYDAIAMEIDAAEAVLKGTEEEQLAYDPVLPVLPFPLLMGILLGARSAEWNTLELRDIYHRPEQIWVHAPNKKPWSLYAMPEVQRAWEVALAWQRRYRTDWAPDGPAVMVPKCESSKRTGEIPRALDELVKFDTIGIGSHLPRFYMKYFLLKRPDGRPVLYEEHPETGEPVPFWLAFSNYRSAAITEYARYEKDPEKLRLFARHEHLDTTLRHYVRNTLDEVRDITVETIGPFSERVRMRVRARRATPGEIDAAMDIGALVPGGACGEVMAGIRKCRRAIDCRLCEHFIIDPRKREWYAEEVRRYRERAERLERERGSMREVQVYLSMAAINDAIVQVIDDFEEGLR